MNSSSSILQSYAELLAWLRHPGQERVIKATPEKAVLYLSVPLTIFILQCHLVQQPNTRFLRLLLGLPAAVSFFVLAFAVRWIPQESLQPYNVMSIMLTIALGYRTLEFALQQEPIRRVKGNEVVPSAHHGSFIGSIKDAVDVSMNYRGVGYDFGEGSGLKLPPIYRPTHDKTRWLFEVLQECVWCYITLDLLDFGLRHWPLIEDIIHDRVGPKDLTWPQRTMMATIVPVAVPAFITLGYNLIASTAVVVGLSPPADWPPIFGRPWRSTSLHDFWAVQWHQILRRTFLVSSGFPLQAIFGKAGLIVGVFASSGFFHSLILTGAGTSRWSWSMFMFFTVQSVGLFLEQLFRRVTGRRVNGPLGWLWTYIFLYTFGDFVIREDWWVHSGFLELPLVPPQLSVCRPIVRIVSSLAAPK